SSRRSSISSAIPKPLNPSPHSPTSSGHSDVEVVLEPTARHTDVSPLISSRIAQKDPRLWPRGEPGPQGIRYSPLVSWLLIIATCRKHVMGTPSLQTGYHLDSIRSLIPTNILLSPGGICRRRLDCLHIE